MEGERIALSSAVLAVEEGPCGVRSNVIAPGPIAGTPGADWLVPKTESFEKALKGALPLGRMGHVWDTATAAVFFFSDAAAWITGGR